MEGIEETVSQKIARTAGILRKEGSEKIKKASVRFQEQYNEREPVRASKVKVGSLVLVRKGQEGKGERYNGPFKVMRVRDPIVTIETGKGIDDVHLNRVKIYYDSAQVPQQVTNHSYGLRSRGQRHAGERGQTY